MPANSPKFSPARSAELLALADAPITGGYDMEELCECGSDYGDHSGLECPQGETQFRPARHALATELRIAVEVIETMARALNIALDELVFQTAPFPSGDQTLKLPSEDLIQPEAMQIIREALWLIGE